MGGEIKRAERLCKNAGVHEGRKGTSLNFCLEFCTVLFVDH